MAKRANKRTSPQPHAKNSTVHPPAAAPNTTLTVPAAATGCSFLAEANVNVSTGDIVAIAVATFEQTVRRQLDLGRSHLRQIDQRIDENKKETANKIEALLQKDYGDQHPCVRTGKAFYEARGLPFHVERKWEDAGDNVILVTLRFYSDRTAYSYGRDAGYNYQHDVVFSEKVDLVDRGAHAVLELREQRKELQKLRQQTLELQTAWQAKLGSLMSVERQARASLAQAVLQTSDAGQQICDHMLQKFGDHYLEGMETFGDVPLLPSNK